MDIIKLIGKLLGSKILSKNSLFAVITMIFIGLNLLSIDISRIGEFRYGLTILSIINILICLIMYSFITSKITYSSNSLTNLSNHLELLEEIKLDYDFIKSKLLELLENFKFLNKNITELAKELNGLPNVKALKLILELRTRGLWNEMFRECLKYTLTVNQESSLIVKDTLINNLNDIVKNYLEFVVKSIKPYDIHETLTSELKSKINSSISILLNEIEKDKRIDEKLYIISLLLKSLQDDINAMLLEYLRAIQSNVI